MLGNLDNMICHAYLHGRFDSIGSLDITRL
jgi:hypothetical protein